MKFKVYAPSGVEAASPVAPAAVVAKTPPSSWPALARLRAWRRATRNTILAGQDPRAFMLAPRDVRRARFAECQPGKCSRAIMTPTGRAKCSAKGCGCDDLHAVRMCAECPLGRWKEPNGLPVPPA